MIGVLMSATLPARLGEPSRALIVARRVGRVRDRLPVVLGTLVSQTLLNLLALAILGGVMFATVGIFRGGEDALVFATIAPVVVIALLLAAPALLRRGKPSRFVRVQQALAAARSAMVQVSAGPGRSSASPGSGAWAALDAARRLGACSGWRATCCSWRSASTTRPASAPPRPCCSRSTSRPRCPPRPSNLGVFQAACVAVLSAYGVGKTDALAYGIILQAVEIATALAHGHARAGARGHDLEGPAPARAARHAGRATRLAPAARPGRGRGLADGRAAHVPL